MFYFILILCVIRWSTRFYNISCYSLVTVF